MKTCIHYLHRSKIYLIDTHVQVMYTCSHVNITCTGITLILHELHTIPIICIVIHVYIIYTGFHFNFIYFNNLTNK